MWYASSVKTCTFIILSVYPFVSWILALTSWVFNLAVDGLLRHQAFFLLFLNYCPDFTITGLVIFAGNCKFSWNLKTIRPLFYSTAWKFLVNPCYFVFSEFLVKSINKILRFSILCYVCLFLSFGNTVFKHISIEDLLISRFESDPATDFFDFWISFNLGSFHQS